MVIEGMSVLPMCLKVSLKVPLLSPWYQVTSCMWKVSKCSECFSEVSPGISYSVVVSPMVSQGIPCTSKASQGTYMSRLLLKVSFKVSQGCPQGATQSLSHYIFDPGLLPGGFMLAGSAMATLRVS